jgi:hypothetical protein
MLFTVENSKFSLQNNKNLRIKRLNDMKRIHYTKTFKKDYKTVIKRDLDVNKLMKVIQICFNVI